MFKKEFTRLHDAAFPREDKNKSRNYGINLMNKILEKKSLNYKVESHSNTGRLLISLEIQIIQVKNNMRIFVGES